MDHEHVYVVIEYGDDFMGSYPHAYVSFEQARHAVKTKHAESLAAELAESGGVEIGLGGSTVDVPENPSGTTELHLESADARVEIVKLPILVTKGGRRGRQTKRRTHRRGTAKGRRM